MNLGSKKLKKIVLAPYNPSEVRGTNYEKRSIILSGSELIVKIPKDKFSDILAISSCSNNDDMSPQNRWKSLAGRTIIYGISEGNVEIHYPKDLIQKSDLLKVSRSIGFFVYKKHLL